MPRERGDVERKNGVRCGLWMAVGRVCLPGLLGGNDRFVATHAKILEKKNRFVATF